MIEKHRHITDLLLQSHGIDASGYDPSFLSKSIQKRITETQCGSAEAYYNLLEQSNKEGRHFFDSLHISHSEFFRNPLTFAVLERIILPAIVVHMKKTKRKEIRIWSAACAAGQEPYSLAMLLEELKNGDSEKFNYRIFATDQNETQVAEALSGQYAAEALNSLNLKRGKQWFTKSGETYTVKPELKNNIDFSVFDLFSEYFSCPPSSIFGDFDLVVCANLLFYYTPGYRKIILEKTGNSMANGGFLVTGEAERDILKNYYFHEVYPQSGIFQKN